MDPASFPTFSYVPMAPCNTVLCYLSTQLLAPRVPEGHDLHSSHLWISASSSVLDACQVMEKPALGCETAGSKIITVYSIKDFKASEMKIAEWVNTVLPQLDSFYQVIHTFHRNKKVV